MNKWQYKKGLQDLGNGVYAYLQPDGSWGWSNAGLSFYDAANDIALGEYGKWTDTERIVINVFSQYNEFNESNKAPEIVELLALMQRYKKDNSVQCNYKAEGCNNPKHNH